MKKKGTKWTPAELARLAALYPDTDNDVLSTVFGRTALGIKRKAEDQGHRKSAAHTGRWSAEDSATLTRLYSTTQLSELMRMLGRTKFSILSRAWHLGLEKSHEYTVEGRTGAPPMKRTRFLAAGRVLLARPTGACMREMAAAANVAVCNAKSFLLKAVRCGQLFKVGHYATTRYFPSLEAAEAGAFLLAEEMARRRLASVERKNAADRALRQARRALRPSKQVKAPKVLAAKAAQPPRPAKVKAPKPAAPLRLAGSAVRKATPTSRGPAYLPGDVDTLPRSPGFRHVVYPTLPQPTKSNTFIFS